MRFSTPEQLHSDQGRQFESQLLREVCKLMHMLKIRTTQIRTTPYHPQSNRLVEWLNQTMLAMLATCTKDNPLDWEKKVRKVYMACNTSIQASTGYTPFFLCSTNKPGYRQMLLYTVPISSTPSVNEHAATLCKQLNSAFSLAQSHSLSSHFRQKEIYDEKVHGRPYKKGFIVATFSLE